MRKVKCLLTVFVIMGIFVILNFKSNASEIVVNEERYPYETIGCYAVTQSVSSTKKVYIDESVVSFIELTRREVFNDNDKFYYWASPYVDRIVSIREIRNDIDSVIFMVNELENRAKEKTSNASDYKNLCLGYLRSINKNYADDGSIYGSKWKMLAGNIDESFVKEINSDYSHGLRFNEFFSQFVNYEDNYNKSLHGDLDTKYQRDGQNPPLRLIDPQNKKKEIDLIHMFASIDGIYSKTGASFKFGNNANRDIVSWNGDLQTAVRSLKSNNHNLNFNTSDFYDIMNADIGCSEDDILADIDAMNITKGYLDIDENTLTDSLTAYYAIIKTFPFRRFTMFMYTATIEVEYETLKGIVKKPDDAFLALKKEIYFEFNLKEESDGSIKNVWNYAQGYVGNYIMTSYGTSIPSKEIREFITKNFIKYLKANITQAEC